MVAALAFWVLAICCCGYAAVAGGRDGRAIAAIYLSACVATVVAWWVQPDWRHTNQATFAVDLVLLVALVALALRSQRWFPIWFAGLHLLAIVSHAGSILAPGFAYKVYFLMQAFWAVPMLLSLAIGVALDRRAGIADDRPGAAQPGHG